MSKKQYVILVICTAIFAFLGGMVSVTILTGTPAAAFEQPENPLKAPQAQAPGDNLMLGIVKNGTFQLVEPGQPLGAVVRLTGIQMQEARPPESEELNLQQYEGKAIMVSGHGGGSWVYRAAVIDSGSPIVTALVRRVFLKSTKNKPLH
ncbi:MAG: hypothetical protein GY757_27765 [bacterium]|nr:hypothetical protein [bacterium]